QWVQGVRRVGVFPFYIGKLRDNELSELSRIIQQVTGRAGKRAQVSCLMLDEHGSAGCSPEIQSVPNILF
uniref:Uncharacterized protein n=1 Tax=Chrysemys picta bellii TaxID=8478 RepID=A0A8C3P547_CHRPI